MYYLEQAARVTVKALSTGQKLKIVEDKVNAFPALPSGCNSALGGGYAQVQLEQAATFMLHM